MNIEKCFGANIKRLRLSSSMTQEELGNLIGYSEKAVSKWERGISVPSAAVLIDIAKLFKVKLDDLFKEDKFYLLGIDGGGTKTHIILSDCDMNVIREIKVGSCNPIDIGIEETKRVLRNAIYTVCDGIPLQNVSVFAGISGGTSFDMKSKLNEFFRELGFYAYESDTDNRNTVAAGLGKGNGVALIMGTGICAFCQKELVHTRVAGWGYLFDDGGCAYNIGRDGLAAYYRAYDGSGKPNKIYELIKREYPDPQQLLGELYGGGKKAVAAYAHFVYDAARENDSAAMEILQRNMKFAANVIETAAAALTEPRVKVVLAGGLTKERMTFELLLKELSDPEKYELCVLNIEPVQGALMLAKELYEKKKGGETV